MADTSLTGAPPPTLFRQALAEFRTAMVDGFTALRPADADLQAFVEEFAGDFERMLPNDKLGKATWALTRDEILQRARELALQAELRASAAGAATVGVDHLRHALASVKPACNLLTGDRHHIEYCRHVPLPPPA